MKRLTIQGLVNELSYDLNMEELEKLVLDYQDTVIDFITSNQYSQRNKREFREVCDELRSDKYFRTVALLINADDERIVPDMAYVLYTICNFSYVDDDMKAEALGLGYKLRERELGKVVSDVATNTCIILSSVKGIRGYETTPFIRTKCIENILLTLPEVLYNAYDEKYDPSQLSVKLIFAILSKAVPDVRPEEIITAFCKTEFPTNVSDRIKSYALRLRAFLYEICGRVSEDLITKALLNASRSIARFNERHDQNESFANKYLNFKMLEVLANNSNGKEAPESMKKAYRAINTFRQTNRKFMDLF